MLQFRAAFFYFSIYVLPFRFLFLNSKNMIRLSRIISTACMNLQEVFPVRALSFHPGGEFLLVTTDHPTIRLYNVETAQCFVCSAPGDQHKDVVMDVCFLVFTHICDSCCNWLSIRWTILIMRGYMSRVLKMAMSRFGMAFLIDAWKPLAVHMTVLQYVPLNSQGTERWDIICGRFYTLLTNLYVILVYPDEWYGQYC